jgi:hypothetical protein
LGLPVISLQAWRHPATLEQYFDIEIRQRIGPLVALGDPNDYVPPGGAAREYFADEQWIAEFRGLAGRCRFLIMRAGKSENLQRELSMLRELSLLDNLFIVTSAGSPLAHSAEIMGYLFRAADVAAVFCD